MRAFSVRAARPADHAALADILAELLGKEALSASLASALNANLLRLLAHPGTTLLIAESDKGQALGLVTIWSRWGLFDDAPVALIDRVLVRPSLVASAVAPALLEQALGAAQALGSTRVEFVPTEDSQIDEEILERFGFSPVQGGRYALDIL